MGTGFVYDERYLEHDTGLEHPESPARLKTSIAYLEKLPWFNHLKRIDPRNAEMEWIRQIHSETYIERVEKACKSGAAVLDTPDVTISRESYQIATLAAGATLQLADAVMANQITNGFALLRPPGHHAENNLAMGFCLFNNIAILSRYLQKKHRLDKILILDWDVHHGNGTQHTFEEDPSVLYISLHQYPFYPGTGAVHETGKGHGKGATLNCPMLAGHGNSDYETAFQNKIIPKINEFKPDIILISAGFDAHADDPIANINLTTEFYGWMSQRIMELADQHTGGKIISLLEGGYNLRALPLCIAQHLIVLSTHKEKK